jgi:hypothetical protein
VPRRSSALTLRVIFGFGRTVLLVGALLCVAGPLFAQAETPSTPGQAIPGTQGVSPFAASTPTKLVPGILAISLQDAIDRGLKQNLGALLSSADVRSARGQRWDQLSALLPHVTVGPYVAVSQINLAELGFTFSSPGSACRRRSVLSPILTPVCPRRSRCLIGG